MKAKKKAHAYPKRIRQQAATLEAVRSAPVQSPELNSRKGCLDTAMAAVLGDRQLNYGTAEDNFARIAHLHNAWLEVRNTQTKFGPDGVAVGRHNAYDKITPGDVAIMAIMTKIARLANTPAHADSWADIAGYAACGAAVNGAKFNED
jgi:hypothetical protein